MSDTQLTEGQKVSVRLDEHFKDVVAIDRLGNGFERLSVRLEGELASIWMPEGTEISPSNFHGFMKDKPEARVGEDFEMVISGTVTAFNSVGAPFRPKSNEPIPIGELFYIKDPEFILAEMAQG